MLPDRTAAACQGGDLLPQVVSALTRRTSPKLVVQCGRPSLSMATEMQEFGGNSTPCYDCSCLSYSSVKSIYFIILHSRLIISELIGRCNGWGHSSGCSVVGKIFLIPGCSSIRFKTKLEAFYMGGRLPAVAGQSNFLRIVCRPIWLAWKKLHGFVTKKTQETCLVSPRRKAIFPMDSP